MDSPAPIDISKLKAILGNAKKVMAKAEELSPTMKKTQPVNEDYGSSRKPSRQSTPNYDEMDEREPEYKTPDLSKYASEPQPARDYTEEDIRNSKLPDVIKEAMLKKPIARPSMSFSKFSLDGLEDLIEKPINKQPIREAQRTSGSNMITISESELNDKIDRRVSEILANMFAKTITEQAIKKTVSTLISEGKITVKKK